eukprot:5496790-Lingulodinium_polyedra.AAC.1
MIDDVRKKGKGVREDHRLLEFGAAVVEEYDKDWSGQAEFPGARDPAPNEVPLGEDARYSGVRDGRGYRP